jgi:hypothetical protein
MSEPEVPIGNSSHTAVPICVDLDGTLVCTDTLWECLISACRFGNSCSKTSLSVSDLIRQASSASRSMPRGQLLGSRI